jgi:hypothetical protein
MSDVVIKGNASGTGSVTIESPNTNSDYTVTLPTGSGELVSTGGAQTIEFAAGSASTPSITTTGDTNTGIFFPAADNIAFAEGGAEAMRINSSGNVGIGTTSPGEALHLNRASGDRTAFRIQSSAGNCYMVNRSGTSAMDLLNAMNGPMTFATNNGERARIDSSGNLLVGTTSNTSTLGCAVRNAFDSSTIISLGKNNGAGSGLFIDFNFGGAQRGYINWNGSNLLYTNLSDYRLKENIAPMTGALATVAQLKPCTYTWKENGSAGQGFIAHELQAVVPDCVTGEKDAVNEDGSIKPQGVDTSFLVATLTAAIQELSAKNDALEARIATLEAQA